MASIRKRCGKYQVQVRINGYTRSKTFPCHKLARAWANRQEIIAFTETRDRDRYTPANFREILNKYWEWAQQHHKGAAVEQIVIRALFKERWVNKPLHTLCRNDIIEFRDHRLQRVKASTFKRQLNIIKSAARTVSEQNDWIDVLNLFQSIKLPQIEQFHVNRITPEMEERLLYAATQSRNKLLKPLIALAIDTGLRRGELLQLDARDFDLESGLLTITKSKNGQTRLVPLNKRARKTMVSLKPIDGCKFFPLSPNAVRQGFNRVRRRANLPRVRFHDLRHEAISRLFELGLSVPEVQLISGHSTSQELLRYAHANEARIMSMMRCNRNS